jgi:uncharacterized protein
MMKRLFQAWPVSSFLAITFGFAWALHIPVFAVGMEASWVSWGLITAGALGPLVGALVVIGGQGNSISGWLRRGLRFRVRFRWYVAAIMVPVVAVGIGTAVFAAMGYRVSTEGFTSLGAGFAIQIPLPVLFEAVVGGGKEEFGWRGLLLPMLQERFSALAATLVVGLAWAAWHLPLFLSPAAPHSRWPLGQQLLWGVSIVAFAVILGWLFNTTRSIWLATVVGVAVVALLLVAWHGRSHLGSGVRPGRGFVMGDPAVVRAETDRVRAASYR